MTLPLVVATLTLALWVPFAHADNTTCIDSQLDWYTAVVGESPCVTYQRLRQICNEDYEVPAFNIRTIPGDRCDDPDPVCCCNTIAFQLIMLCMNCQYDTVEGQPISAPPGAYAKYRKGCGAGTNNSLPNAIQAMVCTENIRLDDFLYGSSFKSNDSWSYAETKETAESDHAANNNNTFTHCPDQISPSNSTLTPTSNGISGSEGTSIGTSQSSKAISSRSAAQTSTGLTGGQGNKGSHVQTGVLVGGVVGGVCALVISTASFFFWRRRRSGIAGTPAIQDCHDHHMIHSGTATGSVTPFVKGIIAEEPLTPPPVSTAPPTYFSSASTDRWSENEHLSDSPPRACESPNVLMTGPLHHEDGGSVIEAGLVRSSSGRLPPVYNSWRRDADTIPQAGTNQAVLSTDGLQDLELRAAAATRPLPVTPLTVREVVPVGLPADTKDRF